MKLLYYLIPLTHISCTDNHSHDGIYEANVLSHKEILEVNGNEIDYKGILDNKVAEEIKTTCQQFNDRIEFKDKNGLIRVLRIDSAGNLISGEYIYKKEKDEESLNEIKESLQVKKP
jgi:hypothetical protein